MIPILMLAAAMTADCPPDDITASPQLYEVTAGTRLPFYRTADCADASCREGAYVIPGDRVVVYGQVGARSCAMFEGARETSGWVDSGRLRLDVAAAHPAPAAWIGTWYDGDDEIRLQSSAGGRLRVGGDAYWPSAHPTRDWPSGWPHTGEMDGMAAIAGNRAMYSDGADGNACQATFVLLRDDLLVTDNGNCGGANVRFRGVYRRKHARS